MSKPRKRKGSPFYWYDFTVGGNRFRGSTETDCLETAKKVIAKLRTDAVNGQHFEKRKDRMDFDTACGRFLVEHAQYLKSYEAVNLHCGYLLNFFGGKTDISTVADKDINAYITFRRNKNASTGKPPVSDTTINRELAALRKMLNTARDKWEVAVPDINFRTHMLREPEARTRWISHDEADLLVEKASDHLKPVIRFALLTGVRRSNITGLKWKDVNLKHREISFRIKSNIPGGKLLTLPIADALMEVLTPLQVRPQYENRKQVRDHQDQPVMYITSPDDYVFTYKGEPIRHSFKKSFKTACDKAEIEDFRFHDLRHTAASWMIQSGIPIDLVQEILGHTQIATTKKYAHRDQSEKMEALQRMQSFMTQSRHIDVNSAKSEM